MNQPTATTAPALATAVANVVTEDDVLYSIDVTVTADGSPQAYCRADIQVNQYIQALGLRPAIDKCELLAVAGDQYTIRYN